MICSPVSSVDKIYWPKRRVSTAMKAESVVIIPDGRDGIMVVKLANGGFVSSRDISKFAYLPGQYPWMEPTIKALVKLGAISQEAADEHMAVCEKRRAENAAHYNADSMVRLSEETGIELSASQRQYVSDNLKKGPVF